MTRPSPREPVDKLRVAFVLDSFEVGGTELNAVRTAERLNRDEFQLSVLALRAEGPLLARYREAGIPVREFRLTSLASLGAARQAVRMAGHLREEGVQLVHCHDRYSNVLGVLAGKLAGVPAIIASRRWWSFDRRSHAIANGLAYRVADRVLTNSASGEKLLRQEGVRAEDIFVLENFLEARYYQEPRADEHLALLSEIHAPADALIVGIVANVRAIKDHASLVRAMARLAPRWPTAHLVCVGSGPLERQVTSLAAELGISNRVHMVGHRDDAARLHSCFDVSVLCSLHEGFPNSVIEAMAAGRPVVATNVGGTADAVLDGVTGFLVSPSNPVALAAAVESLLADGALRRRMGEAGRVRARSVYHEDVVLPKLTTFYESLLRNVTGAKNQMDEASVDVNRMTPAGSSLN